jgi:hypothetical protein
LPTPVPAGQSVTATATNPELSTSEFSPALAASVVDSDNDGGTDAIEDGAPNGGDGNQDGIPDGQQINVSSLISPVTADYVTVATPSETQLLEGLLTEHVASAEAPPPAEAQFPIGLLSFNVEGLQSGMSTMVRLFIPPDVSYDSYFKFGPTPDNPTNHWYEFRFDGTTGAEILVGQIVLHFIDGQRGDDDLTPDGRIVDLGGPVLLQNEPPTVEQISSSLDPRLIHTVVNATATFRDADVGQSHTAVWTWGDGAASVGTVTESGGSGSITGSHVYTTPGVYTVTLAVTDNLGGSGQATFHYIVVYDPDGGFVTGGGWINSPAGAYTLNPASTGKATFGFNSKYEQGKTVPTGQTQFNFHAGDLDFHSTSYEWLVISGAKARYKGLGKINGQGSYGFLLIAIDGQVNGGGGVDKFRIKIWENTSGHRVVYDNEIDVSEEADPSTALGGGSIVIHKEK